MSVNNEKTCSKSKMNSSSVQEKPPSKTDEIVITGMAGRFPGSENVYQLRDHLLNKINMVTESNRKWNRKHQKLSVPCGKLLSIDRFDAGFFGVHYRQAITMDPMVRLTLETTTEAILDAGYHPSELEGTKTGVFIGATLSETEKRWFIEDLREQYFAITGLARSMLANRVSYYLKLNAPSYTVDTACSGSLNAFVNAYQSIKNGTIDAAIVVGVHLCLNEITTLELARLGIVSKSGVNAVFDTSSDGYVRSEACSAIFLQKSNFSRRIYGHVVHCKSMNEGFKQEGIYALSVEALTTLLNEVYDECMVSTKDVSYVEAHGTGTIAGDLAEANSIDAVFCKDRKNPLLIGSIKSNMGHTEPASGITGIIKILLALNEGVIPPNLNFNQPRLEIEAIAKGRMRVVTENTPISDNDNYFGINNFGFGGAVCHALLRKPTTIKVSSDLKQDNLPRLVCVSGRTKEAVNTILEALEKYRKNREYIRLYHQIFSKTFVEHNYRGYIILTKEQVIKKSLSFQQQMKQPLCLIFSDFSHDWIKIYEDLKDFPIFSKSMKNVNEILMTENLNLPNIQGHDKINEIIGNLAVQIGLVDMLKAVNVRTEATLGLGLGEFICSYFEGHLTLEKTVRCVSKIVSIFQNSIAYSIETVVNETPDSIRHTDEMVVIGHKENLSKSIVELKNQGIIVKTASALERVEFSKIKPKSARFLSRILNKTEWVSSDIDVLTSNDFVLELIDQSVLLLNFLQKNSLVFEIGTTVSLTDSCKKNFTSINFKKIKSSTGMFPLFENLGRLYNFGFTMDLAKIYPNIEYPVSRTTPMISPFFRWDHSKSWFVEEDEQKQFIQTEIEIDINSDIDSDYGGYVIEGNRLIPTMSYLFLVWRTLTATLEDDLDNIKITFENCYFLRTINVSNDKSTKITVTLKLREGYFEILESDMVVVTGQVFITYKFEKYQTDLPMLCIENGGIPLKSEDIYKELRLRGHTYSDNYRNLLECTDDISIGKIQWTSNWVTFIESMIQMSLLQIDTCNPCIPNYIHRLTINLPQHLHHVKSCDGTRGVCAYIFKDCGIIKCGGIEISGLRMEQINKKTIFKTPALHRFQFIPFESCLNIEEAVLVNVQLALENTPIKKAKIVEIIDDKTSPDSEPLALIINETLPDLPLIQGDITVLTNKQLNLNNIKVEHKSLGAVNDCYLIIGTSLLERPSLLDQTIASLSKDGYLLSRERVDFDQSQFNHLHINILTIYRNNTEKLIFCRKFNITQQTPMCIRVDDLETFEWLTDLQESLKINKNVIIYSENQRENGILGLINCIRREPDIDTTRAVLINDKNAPKFNVNDRFYMQQLNKSLAINVYQNGQWGSYRHLRIDNFNDIECEQSVVNVNNGVSKVRWIEGSLKFDANLEPEQELIQVYYTSLNSKDASLASKANSQILSFVGRDSTGQRVMGMLNHGNVSNLIVADKYMLWPVPDQWSMEEAATIPAAYSTVFTALFLRSSLKSGDSILIHSGTSDIGQAAINLCLHYGCRVFTRVETPEQLVFLKKHFSKLSENVIGNSQDTNFEQIIGRETNGRGVDFVLNSLSGEKLLASIRCLAVGGQFLQIQFDNENIKTLQLLPMAKESAFIGVNLDQLFSSSLDIKLKLNRLLLENIANGSVQPLFRIIFERDNIESALNFMMSNKNIEKVLLKIHNEKEEPIKMTGTPKYLCDPDKVVIILGGLGGFGLELSNWLVGRGARKLVLSSRRGIQTGYQMRKIRSWRSCGVIVLLSTIDTTTRSGCEQLIAEAETLGKIQSIFNLAVVLHDALLKNQTLESFRRAFLPKAYVTRYLDMITRRKCPELRDFVVFSSCTCGIGNAGQTNYGMANSVMERICEKRKEDGYAALVIEWGTIGDVGVFAENPTDTILRTTGIEQQSIACCLEVLDILLLQNYPIVASFMIASKENNENIDANVIESVAKILGIKNLKAVSLHSTFSTLGADSLNSFIIKQILEREFQIILTSSEIYNMTFAKLYEMQNDLSDHN